MTVSDLRQDALLYAQRALLGLVPPELRAVELSWNEAENAVHLRCLIDAVEVLDETWELMNEVHTHLVADMPPSTSVTWEAETAPAPIHLSLAHDGVWVFMRYEAGAHAS